MRRALRDTYESHYFLTACHHRSITLRFRMHSSQIIVFPSSDYRFCYHNFRDLQSKAKLYVCNPITIYTKWTQVVNYGTHCSAILKMLDLMRSRWYKTNWQWTSHLLWMSETQEFDTFVECVTMQSISKFGVRLIWICYHSFGPQLMYTSNSCTQFVK